MRKFLFRQGLLAIWWAMWGLDARAVPIDPERLASTLRMDPSTVRVRLTGFGRVVTIRGEGLALSLAKRPDLGNVRSDEWVIDCKRSLILEPSTGRSRQIPRSGLLIESLSGVLSVDERRFREQLVVYPKELLSPYDESVRSNPQCLLVNHIHLERYLEGVVNAEFNSSWASQAVEAQIIAARTYALFQMAAIRKDRGRVFDVESTQKDQVYLGLDRVDAKASELVARTRGLVMVPKTGKIEPIKAFYHASCGGRTQAARELFGADYKGMPRGVPCPFCSGSPSYEWEYRLSFAELQKKLWNGIEKDPANRKFWPAAYLTNPDRWVLWEVRARKKNRPVQKSPIGSLIAEANAAEERGRSEERVEDLEFHFLDRENNDKRLKVSMNAYTARNWLDPARLKSTWFHLNTQGRLALFRGKGSGHGVGMCQWGAKKMGERGFTRDQILLHYYPGVKIARISR